MGTIYQIHLFLKKGWVKIHIFVKRYSPKATNSLRFTYSTQHKTSITKRKLNTAPTHPRGHAVTTLVISRRVSADVTLGGHVAPITFTLIRSDPNNFGTGVGDGRICHGLTCRLRRRTSRRCHCTRTTTCRVNRSAATCLHSASTAICHVCVGGIDATAGVSEGAGEQQRYVVVVAFPPDKWEAAGERFPFLTDRLHLAVRPALRVHGQVSAQ